MYESCTCLDYAWVQWKLLWIASDHDEEELLLSETKCPLLDYSVKEKQRLHFCLFCD